METVIAKRLNLVLLILMTVLFPSGRVVAERLAVHTYTVADGLAGDQITSIAQDSRGFLWIGTRTGLSRFDGVGFRSFDTADGLPLAGVYDILESSDGTLWFGTGGGLVRMRAERDKAESAFEMVAGITNGVVALAEDSAGTVWASSRGRLYRGAVGHAPEFAEVETGITWLPEQATSIGSLVADPDGSLWLGANIGLFRRLADGTLIRYRLTDEQQDLLNNSLFLDSTGRLWVGRQGVVVFKPETASSLLGLDHRGVRLLEIDDGAALPVAPGRAVQRNIDHPLGSGRVFGLDQGPDGAVWAVSHWGAGIVGPEGTATHGRHTGLVSDHLSSVLVDDVGNV